MPICFLDYNCQTVLIASGDLCLFILLTLIWSVRSWMLPTIEFVLLLKQSGKPIDIVYDFTTDCE